MTVAPSPLNGVKIDLGVVVVLLPVVWLVAHRVFATPGEQLVAMGGFSVVAALWLVLRVQWAGRRAHEGTR